MIEVTWDLAIKPSLLSFWFSKLWLPLSSDTCKVLHFQASEGLTSSKRQSLVEGGEGLKFAISEVCVSRCYHWEAIIFNYPILPRCVAPEIARCQLLPRQFDLDFIHRYVRTLAIISKKKHLCLVPSWLFPDKMTRERHVRSGPSTYIACCVILSFAVNVV